jgi:nucleotide-binding universal stress UspA family protein
MYKRILVPIDGSKPSDKALDHAINLVKSISISNGTRSGKNDRAGVTILFVIPDLPVPLAFETPMKSLKTGEVISFSDYIIEMHESMKIKAVEMLTKKKKQYESQGISIIVKVIVGGSPSDKIIEFAEDEKVDLIVVGNVGLSGISRVKTLGSVSRSISERAKCPVLIVH